MWVKNVFPGALIEYAVILFKKQKEQKEPKKEAAIHRSSGNISRIYSPECKISDFITKDYVSQQKPPLVDPNNKSANKKNRKN